MKIFFAGGDQPAHLKLLREWSVKKIAVSFYEWQRRYSTDDLSQHFNDDEEIVITAGIAKKTGLDYPKFSNDYLKFIATNCDRTTLSFDIDSPDLPLQIANEMRGAIGEWWNGVVFPNVGEDLAGIANHYPRLGVNSNTVKSYSSGALRQLPTELHGSNITDQKILSNARFATTTTHAWMSPRRFGELWVWSTNRIYRYPAVDMAKGLKAHRRSIEESGVPFDLIKSSDPVALMQIATYSILKMEDFLSRRVRDRETVKIADSSTETAISNNEASDTPQPAISKSLAPIEVNERVRVLLPVFNIKHTEDQGVIASEHGSLRQCDSCFIAEACPKYQPSSVCAFELPVEFRSEADWKAACSVLLEMQFKRVSFGYFAEQLEGGQMNNKIGPEMDRFMKLLATFKEISTPVVGESEGALSKIFGKIPSPEPEEDEIESPDFFDELALEMPLEDE